MCNAAGCDTMGATQVRLRWPDGYVIPNGNVPAEVTLPDGRCSLVLLSPDSATVIDVVAGHATLVECQRVVDTLCDVDCN